MPIWHCAIRAPLVHNGYRMGTNGDREAQVKVRLSDEDRGRLDRLVAHYALNPSALVRMLIKREADAVERAQGGGD